MFDIIVIGAGPAGCTAAKLIAEKGFSVLLSERIILPRNKSCSGCLIKKSIELVRLYYDAEVPCEVSCTPAENKGMVVTDDTGRQYSFPHTGLNVWRSRFDYWIAKHAEKLRSEEISREEYDRWRYRYPEYDTSGGYAKTPQELSEAMVNALKGKNTE